MYQESDQGPVPVSLVSKSIAELYSDRLTQFNLDNFFGIRIAPGVEHAVSTIPYRSTIYFEPAINVLTPCRHFGVRLQMIFAILLLSFQAKSAANWD
jgi:hypothetical protein